MSTKDTSDSPQFGYLDGNGNLCRLQPGTLRPAPEVGAAFFSAVRVDGALVVIDRGQVRQIKQKPE